MTKLVLRQGGTVIGEYPLLKPVVTIGRKPDNDLRIDNLAVSGHHARVVKAGERYVLEDLGSTNGTFLGSKRIKQHVLAEGMEITVGKHTLRFVGEVIKPDAEEQATVFLAPQKPASRSQGAQRVVHPQSAGPDVQGNGGGSRIALIILGILLIAVGIFGVILWLAELT